MLKRHAIWGWNDNFVQMNICMSSERAAHNFAQNSQLFMLYTAKIVTFSGFRITYTESMSSERAVRL